VWRKLAKLLETGARTTGLAVFPALNYFLFFLRLFCGSSRMGVIGRQDLRAFIFLDLLHQFLGVLVFLMVGTGLS